MSVAKWMDEGETRVLQILFGSLAVDGAYYLGLYKNSAEPDENITVADLTEISGYGYARKSLARGSWTISGNQATYAEQTFLAQGGDWGNIYGYFITTTLTGTGGKLVAIEHFGTPFNIVDGKGIKIIPQITIS